MKFEKEGVMMEMKQEMMDDTIDDIMEEEGVRISLFFFSLFHQLFSGFGG